MCDHRCVRWNCIFLHAKAPKLCQTKYNARKKLEIASACPVSLMNTKKLDPFPFHPIDEKDRPKKPRLKLGEARPLNLVGPSMHRAFIKRLHGIPEGIQSGTSSRRYLFPYFQILLAASGMSVARVGSWLNLEGAPRSVIYGGRMMSCMSSCRTVGSIRLKPAFGREILVHSSVALASRLLLKTFQREFQHFFR